MLTLYFVAAMRDNGGGRVSGTEIVPKKVVAARRRRRIGSPFTKAMHGILWATLAAQLTAFLLLCWQISSSYLAQVLAPVRGQRERCQPDAVGGNGE
jgi:hypothetical protein